MASSFSKGDRYHARLSQSLIGKLSNDVLVTLDWKNPKKESTRKIEKLYVASDQTNQCVLCALNILISDATIWNGLVIWMASSARENGV
jgi:hypothetical protein